MSKTYREIVIGFTVRSMECLPDGMDDDDVKEELRNRIQSEVAGWYNGGGQDLLALEPEVH